MIDDMVVFNGIDSRTGNYLLPALDVTQLARIAFGHAPTATERDEVDVRLGSHIEYPLKEGEDPDDLSHAGWAIVFPFARKGSEASAHQAAVREALGPLLALRRTRATGRDERRYRECVGPDAYRPGETKQQFLTRMGAGTGPVDPAKFPYYVLLVASPEEIPYRVQYQLDVQYAVGRIHFDTIEEYAHYASNVVEAETRPRPAIRTVALWGVENPGDRATRASARHLIEPLADYLERGKADQWQISRYVGEHATKARLAALLGSEVPSLLVTASHGIGFPAGDPRQRSDQGGLVCQDWPGPNTGLLTPDHYFSGEDISADADLSGLVGFHFACFGAGTPRYDDFSRQDESSALVDIAPHAFVARLPQRLLGRPRGALACIGHVDRAWASSFLQADPRQGGTVTAQLAVFESTLQRLVDGRCVGHAMDHFDLRYAELASDLASRIEDATKYDIAVNDHELAQLWIYANDARDYAVIGDPAVRIGGRSPAVEMRDPGSVEISAAVPASAGSERSSAVPGTLAELAGSTLDALRRAVGDALSLEITTYAGDVATARATSAGDRSGHPRPAAYTCCKINGGTVLSVPVDDNGTVDLELWRIHDAAVAQARQQRAETLQLILSLLPGVAR